MTRGTVKFSAGVFFFCAIIGIWFVRSEIYGAEAVDRDSVTVTVEAGESAAALGDRLEEEGLIRSSAMFQLYLKWTKLDRNIKTGTFTVTEPITLARVVEALQTPSREERNITILPGWTIRDIAEYLEEEGFGTADQVLQYAGQPAVMYSGIGDTLGIAGDYAVLADKPMGVSYEGYFRPDTYRVFANATIPEILERLVRERDRQFTDEMYQDIKDSGRTIHEVLTIASLLEREVRTADDMAVVADLFWRRYDANWALQADSTVKYIKGLDGSVFTTQADRETDSLWNTYKHPGLPPTPISNPALPAIRAAIYPEPNEYNYFLTTLDTGEVIYARTLDQHNVNRSQHLR